MKIKNWSKFQHFKDRRPPWIKLYRDILDDIEWHQLDPQASKVLVMCWLIASEDEGNLPDTKTLAFRLRMTEKQTSDCVSKLNHWLEHDDIGVISHEYQSDRPERETEAEKETERKAPIVAIPDGVSVSVWHDFTKHRKSKRAQITQRVIDDIAKQAKLAGWTMDDALAETVVRNWQTFKAEWVKPRQTFAQQAADIARTTVPAANTGPDPALVKIEQDRAKAAPMPEHIRQQINSVLRKA